MLWWPCWVGGRFYWQDIWNKMWGWWVMLWLIPGTAEHCFVLAWPVLRVRADEMKAIFLWNQLWKASFAMSWSPLCLLIRRHGDKEFLWKTPHWSLLLNHTGSLLWGFSSCLSSAFFLVTEAVQSHCSSTECWKVSHRYRMLSLSRFLVLIVDILNIPSHFQWQDAKREYIPKIRVLESRRVF